MAKTMKLSSTKVSTVEVDGYTYRLVPAVQRISYAPPYNGGGRTLAKRAARADEAWIVESRSGQVLALLSISCEPQTGADEFCVQRLDKEVAAGDYAFAAHLRGCGRTWALALAEAFS
jgi:hypothetical protein